MSDSSENIVEEALWLLVVDEDDRAEGINMLDL
jgi:hypothetical protein